MQALKVLEIAVEKRILVVSFNLKCDHAPISPSDVVDFMTGRVTLYTVDNRLDCKVMFDPTPIRKRMPQPLGLTGFTASTAD